MSRSLHLNAFLMSTGHHEASWRLPESDPHASTDIEHFKALARTAERGGQPAVALRAWHEAIRLGDTRAVDPLTRLCGEIHCAAGEISLAHARALAAGDAAALQVVSDDLAALGMRAAAADAAAQARCVR